MSKIICSPGSYIQGQGELGKLAEYYGQLGKTGAYLIVDSFIDKTYHNALVSSFEHGGVSYPCRRAGRHESSRCLRPLFPLKQAARSPN